MTRDDQELFFMPADRRSPIDDGEKPHQPQTFTFDTELNQTWDSLHHKRQPPSLKKALLVLVSHPSYKVRYLKRTEREGYQIIYDR
jgi:hypothetical protein